MLGDARHKGCILPASKETIRLMRTILLSLVCLLGCLPGFAADHVVTTFRYAGPYELRPPVLLDSTDVHGKAFSGGSLLDVPVSLDAVGAGRILTDSVVPPSDAAYALHLASFDVQATSFTKGKVTMKGLRNRHVFMDGDKLAGDEVTLKPGTHRFVVKWLSERGQADTLRVTLSTTSDAVVAIEDPSAGQGRMYTTYDVLDGKRLAGLDLSHDGRYLITTYSNTMRGGRTEWIWTLRDLRTGKTLRSGSEELRFLPGSDDYYVTRRAGDGKTLVRVGIDDGKETVLATALPDDGFEVAPDGSYLVLMHQEEGPKEDPDVYEILEPDDRQPGWRNRMSLLLYDLKTGLTRPLTYGCHNVYLLDISRDSRYVLFMTSRSRLTARPTTLFSLYRLDVATMACEQLVCDDGFIVSAKFSPDGRQLVVKGSPECLGGVGKNVPEGRIPSMVDYQLYTFDIATRTATPLTRGFNPSVERYYWSPYDNQLWLTALDKDCQHLFKCNPKTGKIAQVAEPEDMVSSLVLADDAPVAAWYGEGASNSDRLYTLDTKSGRSTLVEDLSKDILKGVRLGECDAWSFVSSRGDTICCRYYLPPAMDKAKRYPLIVNYYGGCSPTSRDFESRYPQHVYASLGYVVLIVNPSGATGFGQEFSSRHVNTAGKGVADDIIEATRRFCEEHPFVDGKKIGCIGASYGGFMTQYLQTQTDLFAAAISHAGISDHTSYWGEGYWGYSYSEVSMAGSYPWTRKDLYVDQSPLFLADKIHTPLLFLHGSKDTNVPMGESIQMFTALKLLGRPTAFVVVDGQDHHVTDYAKRLKWQDTIFAWFQKWLKGDSSWWDALYPEKTL